MPALMKQKSNGFTDKKVLMCYHSYPLLEIDLYIAYENAISAEINCVEPGDQRTEPCLSPFILGSRRFFMMPLSQGRLSMSIPYNELTHTPDLRIHHSRARSLATNHLWR